MDEPEVRSHFSFSCFLHLYGTPFGEDMADKFKVIIIDDYIPPTLKRKQELPKEHLRLGLPDSAECMMKEDDEPDSPISLTDWKLARKRRAMQDADKRKDNNDKRKTAECEERFRKERKSAVSEPKRRANVWT